MKERANRKKESIAEKAFGASLQYMAKKGFHKQNGIDFRLRRHTQPYPWNRSKCITYAVTVQEIQCYWLGSRKGAYKLHTTSSVADSGCQASTAGVDFLKSIGCSEQ